VVLSALWLLILFLGIPAWIYSVGGVDAVKHFLFEETDWPRVFLMAALPPIGLFLFIETIGWVIRGSQGLASGEPRAGLRLSLAVVILLAGLSGLWIAGRPFLRHEELTCAGKVTWEGNGSFPDRIALTIAHDGVRVGGAGGEMSSFEGGLPYKICSESEDELDMEYSARLECGKDDVAPRYGQLNKILGNLRLSRSLNGRPFVGEYKCEPAKRVVK
jgi:hypothetical protein